MHRDGTSVYNGYTVVGSDFLFQIRCTLEMLCQGHPPLPIEMGRGGGAPSLAWHAGELELWTCMVVTCGSRRWAVSCLFLGQGHRGFRHLFLCCRQARCAIDLSLPCFFMPLFSFLIYLLCYRSCEYVIVFEMSDYNMHLVLIVACLIFFSICKFSSNTFLITIFVQNPIFFSPCWHYKLQWCLWKFYGTPI